MESIVASALDMYLGSYVHGLVKENFNLNITRGDLEMENLAIKKEALQDLKLPIVVKSGFLGRLRINIPWSTITSQPAVIKLEKIFIIIGAKKTTEYDEAMEEKQLQFTKQKRLYLADLLRDDKTREEREKEKTAGSTFTGRLLSKIIDNIQLEVEHVHIRFEDDTSADHPFAWGITLQSLIAKPVNHEWQAQANLGTQVKIHKLVNITNLAVYWDVNSRPLRYVTNEELGLQLDQLIYTNTNFPEHSYLLDPVSGIVKLVLNDVELDPSLPRAVIEFQIDRVAVTFRRAQFLSLNGMVNYFISYLRRELYLKFRPSVPPKGNAAKWWRYAVNATMFANSEKRKRWTWAFISRRREERVNYINLYRKKKTKQISPDEERALSLMEIHLNFDDIYLYRALTEALLRRAVQRAKQAAAETGFSLPGLLPWSRSAMPTEDASRLSTEEWKELYGDIDYQCDQAEKPDLAVPRDYVKAIIRGVVDAGSLQIDTDRDKSIAHVTFSRLAISVQKRPESALIAGGLDSLNIIDRSSTRTKFPCLFLEQPRGNADTDSSNVSLTESHEGITGGTELLAFQFEDGPLTGAADFELQLQLCRPLSFVVSRTLIDGLVGFFSVTADVAKDQRELTTNTFEKLRDDVLFQMKYSLFSKKTLLVRILANHLTLMLPRNCIDVSAPLLVLQAAQVIFSTDPRRLALLKDESNIEASLREYQHDYFYQAFNISVQHARLYMSTVGAELRRLEQHSAASRDPVLDQIDGDIYLEIFTENALDMPEVKLQVSLPPVVAHLTAEKLLDMIEILEAIIVGDDALWESRAKRAAAKARRKFKLEHNVLSLFDESGNARQQITKKQRLLAEKPDLNLLIRSPELHIEISHKGRPVCWLHSSAAVVDGTKRTFDFSLSVHLGSLIMDDVLQDERSRFRQFLNANPEEGKNAVQLKYMYNAELSPYYVELDHKIDLVFDTQLVVSMNMDCVIQLWETIGIIIEHFSHDTRPPLIPGAPDEDQSYRKERDPSAIVAKLTLQAKVVHVSLTRGAMQLGRVSVSDLSSLIVVRPDSYHVKFLVRRPAIKDLSMGTAGIWSQILESRGDEPLTFLVESYDPLIPTYPGYDMMLLLHANTLRPVLLQRFFADVKNFFVEVDRRSLLPSRKPEKPQKDRSVRVDIRLRNLYALIPRTSISSDILFAEVGAVTITDRFYSMAGSTLQQKKTTIACSNVTVKGVDATTQVEHQRLLQNLDLAILIESPVTFDGSVPQTRIVLNLDGMRLSFNEAQLRLLFGVVEGNLCEEPIMCATVHKPKPPPLSENPYIDMQWDLNFTALRIDFLFGDRDGRSAAPLFAVAAQKLSIHMDMMSDSALVCDVITTGFVLDDTRPKTLTVFPHFLEPHDFDEHEFSIVYRRASSGNQVMDIIIDYNRIVLIPELLWHVYRYIFNKIGEVLRVVTLWNNFRDPPTGPLIPRAFRLNLRLDHPDLLMIEDITNPGSRMVSIQFREFEMSYVAFGARSTLTMAIRALELYKLRATSQLTDDAIGIIEAFDISYELILTDATTTTGASHIMTLLAEPIHCALSLPDLKLLWAVFAGWILPPPDPYFIPPPLPPKQSLNMDFGGVNMVFLNEYGGGEEPLAVFALSDLAYDISDWASGTMKSFVQLSMRADYYNPQLSTWEPFMEPWTNLKLKMLATPEEMLLSFSSAERLDINISMAFLESAWHYFTSWAAATQPHKLPRSLVVHDAAQRTDAKKFKDTCMIKNETGVPIKYWFSNTKSKIRTLQPGQVEVLSPAETVVQRPGSRDAEFATLSLWLLEEHQATHYLPLDKPGIYFLSLDIQKRQLFYSYEVCFHKGGKLLRIRSAVSLFNELDTALDVRVELSQVALNTLPSPAPSPLILRVAARERFSLPLLGAWYGTLSIRPDEFHRWSELSLPCSTITTQLSKPQLALCFPVAPAAVVGPHNESASQDDPSPFACVVALEKLEENIFSERCTADSGELMVHVSAPVLLSNLLPYGLEFKLTSQYVPPKSHAKDKERERKLASRGYAEGGDDLRLHEVWALQPLGLAIRLDLPGFSWTPSEPLVEHGTMRFNISDADNRAPVHVEVDVELTPHGVRVVSIYTRYWLINRTGLKMVTRCCQQEKIIAGHGNDINNRYRLQGEPRDWYVTDVSDAHPLLFSSNRDDPKVTVKLADSTWSRPLNLKAVTTDARVEVSDPPARGSNSSVPQPTRLFDVVLTWDTLLPKYWRTKQISFFPRYVFINKLSEPILYKQDEAPYMYTLLPEERIPFHWIDSAKPRLVRVTAEDGWNWSGAFAIETIASFPIKLRHMERPRETKQLRVQIRPELSTLVVMFTEERSELPAYRIENRTRLPLLVGQLGQSISEMLAPGSVIPYTWDEPAAEKKRLSISFAGTSAKAVPLLIAIDKFKKHTPVTIKLSETSTVKLCVETFPDGPTKVLKIEEEEQSPVLSMPVPEAAASPASPTEQPFRKTTIALFLEGIGVSIINDHPEEVMYLSLSKLKADYADRQGAQQLEFTIADIQLDNQQPLAMFPVAISAILPEEEKPALFISVKTEKRPHQTIRCFEHLVVLMQELDVHVDEAFLVRLLSMVEAWNELTSQGQKQNDTLGDADSPYQYLRSADTASFFEGQLLYFKVLVIYPIKLRVTYVASRLAVHNLQKFASISRFLDRTGSLANIDAAPLNFNGLMLEHPFCSQPELVNRIWQHYATACVKEVFKILGSVDILGSPISFFSNLGTGWYDFFHEPARGLISSPEDFGKGLQKGTKSLVKKSLYGVFNSTSKITGSLGSGMTALVADEEFARQREHLTRPRDATEGLTHGVLHLGRALVGGVTGIITEPIKGSKQGLPGFLKGMRRGIQNVGLKPAIGIVDFIAITSVGVRNTARRGDELLDLRARIRPPRYFGPDRVLQLYARQKAEGQAFLHTIEHGRFAREYYFAHFVASANSVVLVSNEHLFHISYTKDREKLHWFEQLSNINAMEASNDAITIRLTQTSFGLLLLENVDRRIIPIAEPASAEVVYQSLVELLRRLKLLRSALPQAFANRKLSA